MRQTHLVQKSIEEIISPSRVKTLFLHYLHEYDKLLIEQSIMRDGHYTTGSNLMLLFKLTVVLS